MGKTPVIKNMAVLLVLLIIFGSTLICSGLEASEKAESVNAEIIQVEAFKDSTVILKNDGTVWGWGDNSTGILGEDNDKYVFSPVKIEGFEDIGAISMGNGYLLAVKRDGSVWGIGSNYHGILNTYKYGSYIDKPVRIKELAEVQAVSSGIDYAMAMKADGTVFIWGDYRYKVSDSQIHPPRKVIHAKGVKRISASRYNAFVIDESYRTWFLRGYIHKPEEVVNLEEAVHVYESGKFTYGVSRDGSLWYWTINGQCINKLAGISGVVKLSPYGAYEMIALDKSGFLWKWSEKDFKSYKIEGIAAVKDFAAGSSHIAALMQDGTLCAWGENSRGQLGDGGAYIQRTPMEVTGLKDVESVSASDTFAAALTHDGDVWAWGSNSHGQLGNGKKEDSLLPVKVEGIEGIKYLSTGNSHVVVLKEDGTVWSWGSNSCGELGDGSYEDSLLPVQTVGLKNIISVSAGNGFSMALAGNGTVWVWGNSSYVPKKSKTIIDISKPVKVEELKAVAAIEAGDECSLAVTKAGFVSGWGNNFSGQLGFSPDEDDNVKEKPKAIGGCNYIKSVSIGGGHVLSLSYDGQVKAWGKNDRGQLGNEQFAEFNSPRTIENLKNIAAVTAAGSHSFAIDREGKVWAWGDNTYGQLSNELDSIVENPEQVHSLENVKQIAGRDSYTIVLKNDGKLMVWGENKFGQLGIGSKSTSFVERPKQIIVP